jgi:hypothetical protein
MKEKRRRFKRSRTLVLLNVDSTSSLHKSSRAAVIDIGVGGVAFESSTEFPVNDDVIIRFILPGHNVFVFEGVVKRVENTTGVYVHGVEFKNINFFDKIRLKKLIFKIGWV